MKQIADATIRIDKTMRELEKFTWVLTLLITCSLTGCTGNAKPDRQVMQHYQNARELNSWVKEFHGCLGEINSGATKSAQIKLCVKKIEEFELRFATRLKELPHLDKHQDRLAKELIRELDIDATIFSCMQTLNELAKTHGHEMEFQELLEKTISEISEPIKNSFREKASE